MNANGDIHLFALMCVHLRPFRSSQRGHDRPGTAGLRLFLDLLVTGLWFLATRLRHGLFPGRGVIPSTIHGLNRATPLFHDHHCIADDAEYDRYLAQHEKGVQCIRSLEEKRRYAQAQVD